MFCKYCGKQLPDGDICPECAAKLEEKAAASNVAPPSASQNYTASYNGTAITKSFGIGKAIASIITGISGIISSVISFVFALLSFLGKFPDTVYEDMTPEQIEAFRSMAQGFSVAAIVLLCISAALATAKAQGVKPIATLVVGIIGVVCGAVCLLMTLMAFFWVLAGNAVAA